uniref:Ketoreductase domain-containing protein n=1 Tax=Hyaloperonospora arabidopsidis (strain Emoy2) TaxID=559515 RepID=M4C092_HYAAE
MLRFGGQIALITGSGNGIGRCYALLFAERGAKVEAADSVVKEIEAKGGVAVANYNSVSDGDRVVATAIDHFGRIDILVNNAGILRDASFAKMTKAQWNQVLDVHLQGTFAVTHAAWPYMREQKYGRVVLITSINGLYGQFGQTNYSAMKASMTGFGKSLAKEGARSNIKVNIVAPGAGSKMTASVIPEDLVAKWKPEYVAPTVVYLCHESVPCSGKIFESGGGFVAQVKYMRSRGVFLDLEKEITPEAVQSKFAQITDFADATDPDDDDITPQLKQILPAKL